MNTRDSCPLCGRSHRTVYVPTYSDYFGQLCLAAPLQTGPAYDARIFQAVIASRHLKPAEVIFGVMSVTRATCQSMSASYFCTGEWVKHMYHWTAMFRMAREYAGDERRVRTMQVLATIRDVHAMLGNAPDTLDSNEYFASLARLENPALRHLLLYDRRDPLEFRELREAATLIAARYRGHLVRRAIRAAAAEVRNRATDATAAAAAASSA